MAMRRPSALCRRIGVSRRHCPSVRRTRKAENPVPWRADSEEIGSNRKAGSSASASVNE